MGEIVTVDLSKNPKQFEYFAEVVKSCNGLTAKRKFSYGGAIRGGKSWITLFILTYLCKRYQGSKWYVIRADFTVLQATTIESLKKMLRGSANWKWHEEKGNYYVQHINGSRIYFTGENYARDKDLNDFLGLECNGFFLEQLEELSEKLWDIAASRSGSWYIPNMPPAFMFTTFNPTQKWPKKKIYERFIDGTLPDDFFYMTALPSDNAFVTKDQWSTWGQMADRYQKQFIEGDWTDFDDGDAKWAFGFESAKHVKKLDFIPIQPIHLSFDFNVNPMTCVAMQGTKYFGETGFVHILREFIVPNSNVQEICKQVKAAYPHSVFTVTGDATGRNRNAGYSSGQDNLWRMVQRALGVSASQMLVPNINPSHSNSRWLCNALLQNHKKYYIDESCKQLIHELKVAKPKVSDNPAHEDTLDKGAGSGEKGYNVLDCWRYINHTHFNNFVNISQ